MSSLKYAAGFVMGLVLLYLTYWVFIIPFTSAVNIQVQPDIVPLDLEQISHATAQHLWQNRLMDTLLQAFILTAAALGVATLLKYEI